MQPPVTAPQDPASLLPYSVATLADGREAVIRPMNPSDFEAEREFITALSPESRRFRFQEQVVASDELVAQLVDIDHSRQEAFVAVAEDAGKERIVGVSRYALANEPGTCEIAVTVLDAWQGFGLGKLLMQRLIDAARERGLRRMVSLDFAENHHMTHLARHFGFTTTPDPDDRTQFVHALDL